MNEQLNQELNPYDCLITLTDGSRVIHRVEEHSGEYGPTKLLILIKDACSVAQKITDDLFVHRTTEHTCYRAARIADNPDMNSIDPATLEKTELEFDALADKFFKEPMWVREELSKLFQCLITGHTRTRSNFPNMREQGEADIAMCCKRIKELGL